MMSVAQIESALREVLEQDADRLAQETGFIQRQRAFSGAQFAQALVFGWLDEADATLDELTQVGQECEISISAPGLSKRFTPEAAQFLHALLQRLAEKVMAAEPVEVPLLRRFSAVIVEDSSVVTLPTALVEVWRGFGGSGSASQSAVKLHVRIELLSGSLQGPCVTDARLPDTHSPFRDDLGPWESLHLRDLGYYDLGWLTDLVTPPPGQHRKRFFLIRFKGATVLLTRCGHRLELRGLLPQHIGQVREYGVLVGAQARIPARLILLRVPEEVVKQRRERLEEEAQDRGEPVSEELWYLAQWTMVITNVPRRRLSVPEVLVLLRARWQMELLWKLWKEQGQIDAWRSKQPWRILCEFYAKLMAMLIQHWLLVARPTPQPGQGVGGRAPPCHARVGRLEAAGVPGAGRAVHLSGDALWLSVEHPSGPAQYLATLARWVGLGFA